MKYNRAKKTPEKGKTGEQGIPVSDQLQTSQPDIASENENVGASVKINPPDEAVHQDLREENNQFDCKMTPIVSKKETEFNDIKVFDEHAAPCEDS